jgi:hypothetical protein
MSSNFPELVFDADEDFTADRLNAAMSVIDSRLRSLEPFTPSWQQAVNDLRDVGLSRLNDAILPAYNRIQLLSTLGFLFAGSSSEVTLTNDMTSTFVIDDDTQKELFTPTPFLALTRSSTVDDWAIAQLISYEAATGTLMVKVKTITGNPGPHTDWQIGACAASAIASMAYFAQIDTARIQVNTAKTATAADRVQTGLDRVQTGLDVTAANIAKEAAQAAASGAGTWDPTNYALKTYVDSKIQAGDCGAACVRWQCPQLDDHDYLGQVAEVAQPERSDRYVSGKDQSRHRLRQPDLKVGHGRGQWFGRDLHAIGRCPGDRPGHRSDLDSAASVFV